MTARRLPKLQDRLPLGGTGLTVSPFCLGRIKSEDPKTVPAAFDAGINFFFLSADLHWPLYETLRRGLDMLLSRGGGVRDQLVIGAAAYVTQPFFCWAPLFDLLNAMPSLQRIDLAITGGVYSVDFFPRLSVYQRQRQAQQQGVQALGASFHDRQVALLAVNHGLVDIGYCRYNPMHPGAQQDLFPRLLKPRPTLLYGFTNTYGAISRERQGELGLSEDHWQPDITDYYRFALTRPALDGLLCSPSTPEEVEALSAAMEKGPLEEEEEQYLIDLAALASGRASLDS